MEGPTTNFSPKPEKLAPGLEANGRVVRNRGSNTLVQKCDFLEWKPSPVVSIASSVDGCAVAVARDSGHVEIWRVAPGSLGWNCETILPGKSNSSISSLTWCLNSDTNSRGRLFSGNLDGTITEWNLFSQEQYPAVDSFGGAIWCLSPEPAALLPEAPNVNRNKKRTLNRIESKEDSDDSSSDESEDDADDDEGLTVEYKIAAGCDDGRVQIFSSSRDSKELKYCFSFPIILGRILSVAWNTDATRLFSGTSKGRIHCWDYSTQSELYRLTAGPGILARAQHSCIWALKYLNDGTLVSGDGSGQIQFWDSQIGTLIHSQKRHLGGILSMSISPSQDSIFSAGEDGRVILYQRSESSNTAPWIYVEKRHSHTHDVKCLAVVLVPFDHGSVVEKQVDILSNKNKKRGENDENKINASLPSFIPLLLSGGNDAQIVTYSIDSFLSFKPHKINPHPQIPLVSISSSPTPYLHSSPANESLSISSPASNSSPLLLVQQPRHLEIWKTFSLHSNSNSNFRSGLMNGYPHSHKNGIVTSSIISTPPHTSFHSESTSAGESKLLAEKRKLEFQNPFGKKTKLYDAASGVQGSKDGNVLNGRVISISERKRQIFADLSLNSSHMEVDNVKNPVIVGKINTKFDYHIRCSAISPNGCYVAVSDLSKVRIYALSCTSIQPTTEAYASALPLSSLVSKLSTTGKEKWDIQKKKLTVSLPPAHHLLFCSDSNRLIIAGSDGRIWIYNVSEDVIIHRFPPSSSPIPQSRSPFFFLTCSEDNQWLAACDSSNHIHIYNLESLKLHWTTPLLHSSNLTCATFLQDCETMAVISSTNHFIFLNVESMSVLTPPSLDETFQRSIQKVTESFTHLLSCSSSSLSPLSSPTLIAYNSRYILELQSNSILSNVRESNEKESTAVKFNFEQSNPKGQQHVSDGLVFQLEAQDSPLLFFCRLADNHFLKVHKSWKEVAEKLPAPLYIHKFGT